VDRRGHRRNQATELEWRVVMGCIEAAAPCYRPSEVVPDLRVVSAPRTDVRADLIRSQGTSEGES
jgi:hypothetical protein